MQKQANKAAETLKQLIVRISPVSGAPVLFDAGSKHNGQISCIVSGEEKIVGLDFYQAAVPMEDDAAKQVVQAYAERINAPVENFLVRHRLPKTDIAKPAVRKPRKLNDANLILAADNTKAKPEGQESNQDYRSKSELAAAAQQLHDSATQKPAQEPAQQASAENPEGATVKPQERQRRKYERTPKAARTKRSAAALKRYHEELQAVQKDNPSIMEPVAATVSDEEKEKQVLILAAKLARIILDNKGVL